MTNTLDPIQQLQCEVGALKIILARVLGRQILSDTSSVDAANESLEDLRIDCIKAVGDAVFHTNTTSLPAENIEKATIDEIHKYFGGIRFQD